MNIIEVRNVNEAVKRGIPYLLAEGVPGDSRNGKVLVAPGPVMTIYRKPLERVLFSPIRDANPFFHLMEALWMLDGRNDIAFPAMFNKRFFEYSDDGSTQFGAYGWRWRSFFGCDQLNEIVQELTKNPTSRRCVLSMWNGMEKGLRGSDLYVATHGGKDVPCNTHAYFDLRSGFLSMTVCNRSNDVIWGAYGANAVHFSFLQEYMAERIGAKVGAYRQFSNNFHVYTDIYNEQKLEEIAYDAGITDLYAICHNMNIIPLGANQPLFNDRLTYFLQHGEALDKGDNFFSRVAAPMYRAWMLRKKGDIEAAVVEISSMPYCDWQVASLDWMKRRQEAKSNAA